MRISIKKNKGLLRSEKETEIRLGTNGGKWLLVYVENGE